MSRRIKKKFSKRLDNIIQSLCIMSMTIDGPRFRPPAGSEIDMKAIRRYKRNNVRAYRILNLSKATKGD